MIPATELPNALEGARAVWVENWKGNRSGTSRDLYEQGKNLLSRTLGRNDIDAWALTREIKRGDAVIHLRKDRRDRAFAGMSVVIYYMSRATRPLVSLFFSRLDPNGDNTPTDIREIETDGNLSETTKTAPIEARLGQGRFRRDLGVIEGGCAVLGCDTSALLRAAHIKAWRECTNRERLDKNNGLLLTGHLDALFDKGDDCFSPRFFRGRANIKVEWTPDQDPVV